MFRCFLTGIALLSAGTLSACQPWHGDTEVTIGEALQGQTVEVDIVGVSEHDLPSWQNYSVDRYFGADNSKRNEAKKLTLQFAQGMAQTRSVSRADEVWARQWKDSDYLVVLANPPGKWREVDPARDARKCILDREEMKGSVLRIEVGRAGLSVTVE